jgi:hypothetical protein
LQQAFSSNEAEIAHNLQSISSFNTKSSEEVLSAFRYSLRRENCQPWSQRLTACRRKPIIIIVEPMHSNLDYAWQQKHYSMRFKRNKGWADYG